MRWTIRWGRKHKFMDQRIESGLNVDPEYLDAPVLEPHLEPVWEMWRFLDQRRQPGTQAGPCPITQEDIRSRLDLLGITDREERLHYDALISALDDAYLDHIRERMAQEAEAAKHRAKQGAKTRRKH